MEKEEALLLERIVLFSAGCRGKIVGFFLVGRWSVVSAILAALLLPAALSHAAPSSGTVVRLLKKDQVKVKWDTDREAPEAGRLGLVVDGERNLALVRVLDSRGGTGTVQILDSIWPGVVMGKQGIRLLEEAPPPAPPAEAVFIVWSSRSGQALVGVERAC